jgi:membrane protease YdiL (CAAX protease family)
MNEVHELIRKLPAGVEFLVVVMWAFGLAIFSSILAVGVTSDATVFDNRALISLVITELLQFAFLTWFLRIRGWTIGKIGLRATWRTSAGGVLLAVAMYALFIVLHKAASAALPQIFESAQRQYPTASPALSMELVFVVSVVNGFFEEIFVAGYVITALLQVRSMWLAINVSTVIRLLYHLYQGPLGVLYVIPLGLVLGYVFARTRQLWPLILAHILIDIAGLALAKG